MKFTKDIYEQYEPFGGDRDTEYRCHTSKVVKVRKEHECLFAPLLGGQVHPIKPGEMALCETAIVDGTWGSCYACLDCMDKWLINEVGIEPNKSVESDGEKRCPACNFNKMNIKTHCDKCGSDLRRSSL